MNIGSLNSISATYPGFQSLPKGVKQMLLVTESVFFEEARPLPNAQETRSQPTGKMGHPGDLEAAHAARAILSSPAGTLVSSFKSP
jgi:hypothetical protein